VCDSLLAQRCLRRPGVSPPTAQATVVWLLRKREANLRALDAAVVGLLCVLCWLPSLRSLSSPPPFATVSVRSCRYCYSALYHHIQSSIPSFCCTFPVVPAIPHKHCGVVEIRPSPCANNTGPPVRNTHIHTLHRRSRRQHSQTRLVQSATAIVPDSSAPQSRMLETRTPRQHVPTTHHPLAPTAAVSSRRRP
jgi:hypothetical protein